MFFNDNGYGETLMRYTMISIAMSALIATAGCQQISGTGGISLTGEWLIPINQVYDGGPGKDGIPALTNPRFAKPQEETYLSDHDLVIGIRVGTEVRAYPHPILDWHEIINDEIGSTAFAITYCPLTGSGIAWSRVLNGTKTTFGVSGLLYNTNLIAYDRATNSNWSQMRLECVNGQLIHTRATTYPIVETTWRTWKELYPETMVVSSNTGYSRPYGAYPYGDYRESPRLIFPVSNDDTRLPRKERVHGILVDGKTKAYRITTFPDAVGVINDVFNNLPIVAAGSKGKNVAVSFERTLNDGTILTFSPVQNMLPVMMIDQEGTKWDIFGRAVEGPRAGVELKPTLSYIAYWFAWAAFYPGAEIHGQ